MNNMKQTSGLLIATALPAPPEIQVLPMEIELSTEPKGLRCKQQDLVLQPVTSSHLFQALLTHLQVLMKHLEQDPIRFIFISEIA